MTLNIGFPVVRTDGRAVYGHVITKFSWMGRFTYPWCSAGALRAPELCCDDDSASSDSSEVDMAKGSNRIYDVIMYLKARVSYDH